MENTLLYDKVYGCLLGGMIGDAMGGPSEGMAWKEIEEKFGWIESFEGCGTDDTVIKLILTDAIMKNRGNVTSDEWADAFLEVKDRFYPLYYAPVRNMYHKLQYETTLPVYAGAGNCPSSSSAMAISPMGIINACSPRKAAAETYDLAGMIHQSEATFCRDGASSVAAAIAEAMKPETTVEKILDAATAYLHKKSSKELIDLINKSISAVRGGLDYRQYREWFYENGLYMQVCDSRETIPAAMAIFYLAEGNLETTAVYSANLGRDSDTIGTIAASMAGAFGGASGIRKEWIEQIEAYYNTEQEVSSTLAAYQSIRVYVPDYRQLAKQFIQVIWERVEEQKVSLDMLDKMR